MHSHLLYTPLVFLTLIAPFVPAAQAAPAVPAGGYAIVVSKATSGDARWRPVVDALVAKHKGQVITYATTPAEAAAALEKQFPRYACFVAKPTDVTRQFVTTVHTMTRALDDDPYADVIWGILTGYDAANALRIARHGAPLTVRKVASGTDVALEMCEEGIWYCELTKHRVVRKEKGGTAKEGRGPADTTRALVDTLNEYKADLFVTSGHATERDWQIGFRYRNGSFRSQAGKLFGLDTSKNRHPIDSPSPKVYLPIGNCLMGHIDGPDAMALAFMNSAGVHQMIGYIQPTWYGYAGWGNLDYFVEQPGRYTMAEAFFANHNALIHRLETYFPDLTRAGRRTAVTIGDAARTAGLGANDGRGLLFDRDVVAFYGDPAWEARMADGPTAWKQKLTREGAVYTFEILPQRGEKTFNPINTNGSQRGGRPIVHFLPHRIRNVKLVEGADLKPVVTDSFLLIPNPGTCDPARRYRVVFQAERHGKNL